MTNANRENITPARKIPWQNGILFRSLVLFMVISLLPLLTVGAVTVHYIGKDATQKAESALLESAADLAGRIGAYFTTLKKDMKFVASHFDRDNLHSKDNIRFLAAFAVAHSDIQTIWVADGSGKYEVLFSREEMLEKTVPTIVVPPLSGQDGRNIFWYPTRYNAFGETILTGSVPILAPWEERAAGLLFFEIRPQDIHTLFEGQDTRGKGVALLLDESGQLVSHSNRRIAPAGRDISFRFEAEQSRHGLADDFAPHLSLRTGADGKRVLVAYQHVPQKQWRGGVIIERSESEAYGMRDRLVRLTAGSFLLVILLVTPLAIVFAFRLTTPLAKLSEATTALALGDLSARCAVTSRDEIGVLAGTFNQMADLRQKSEDALATEKEWLSVTLRSIGDGVIATGIDGRIALMNKTAEDLTAWRHEDALGKPLTEVFTIINEVTREPCENPVDKVLRNGSVVGLANHTALIRRDGSEIILADSAAPIRDRESRIIGVVLAFRDITGQYRMENDMQRMQKLESLGLLAGGIAHDFNNLLTAIMGNISLARVQIGPEHKATGRLAEAEKATQRATDLTLQLLTFAKGGIPIKKTSRISEVVKDAVGFALSGSKARCGYSVPAGLWCTDIDRGQIAQVFNNLTINSMNAMPDEGTIEILFENVVLAFGQVPTLPSGNYVKISFSDNGTGIPEKYLTKIFDPYFTTMKQGHGLGLTSAFSILKKHDGYITVDSRPGIGTTFFIYLPASKGSVCREGNGRGALSAGHGRVLIMDDDATIRDVAGQILGALGYEAGFAEDGAQALEEYARARAGQKPYGVVLMDLTIPGGMGGKEAVKKLLEMDPEAKVIVSSGYSTDPIMSDYKHHGFIGVIAKPYNIYRMSEVLAGINPTTGGQDVGTD